MTGNVTRPASKLWAMALSICAVVAMAPLQGAFAAGTETPSPPPPPPTDTKATPPASGTKAPPKKSEKKSSVDDPKFLQDYRAAYATVYERKDYPAAITQLKALGQNDRADVANLIGYSYRKLGDYAQSKVWYERALKADPNHVRTWQYYGLWQVEQGNTEKAREHLAKIEKLAGKNSPEYQSLDEAIAGRGGY